MAGLAGVLMAPTFASDAQLGSRFLIKAFAVIIVGGMGSYPGAIAAAMLLGILEVFGGYAFGQVIGSAMLYLVCSPSSSSAPRPVRRAGARMKTLALLLALVALLAVLPFVGSDYALSFTIQLLMFTVARLLVEHHRRLRGLHPFRSGRLLRARRLCRRPARGRGLALAGGGGCPASLAASPSPGARQRDAAAQGLVLRHRHVRMARVGENSLSASTVSPRAAQASTSRPRT